MILVLVPVCQPETDQTDMTEQERIVAEDPLQAQSEQRRINDYLQKPGAGWARMGGLCRRKPGVWLRYWRNPRSLDSVLKGLSQLGRDFQAQVFEHQIPWRPEVGRTLVVLVRYQPVAHIEEDDIAAKVADALAQQAADARTKAYATHVDQYNEIQLGVHDGTAG